MLGVPAGTFISNLLGWRAPFVVIGILTLGVFVALIVFVPPLAAVEATRLNVLASMIRIRMVRVGLLIYGAVGMVGNFAAGSMVTRNVRRRCDHSADRVGVTYGGVPVCSQAWFVKSFPRGTEAASVLFTSSFQATISVGALLGGVVLDAASPSTVMELGGVMAALMAVAVWTLSRAGQPD